MSWHACFMRWHCASHHILHPKAFLYTLCQLTTVIINTYLHRNMLLLAIHSFLAARGLNSSPKKYAMPMGHQTLYLVAECCRTPTADEKDSRVGRVGLLPH